ncbi:hypothetical protein HHK36_007809 [Tetracentron sinense]|uniref:Uncharacterized protein n=1 Tax=Tetracentron sinense TaxID=13715 RepID=A0A834ZFA8_TETSI|nr:hypothetical protein HHK36_007809 [Tetracentron sinense]
MTMKVLISTLVSNKDVELEFQELACTSLPSQNRRKLSSIVWFGVLGKKTPQISELDPSASSSPSGILGVSRLPVTTKVSPPLFLASGNVPKDSWGFSTSGDHEDVPSSMCHERVIIVANHLPLHAQRDTKTARWCFSLDEDSLLLHRKDGFPSKTEVIYVGCLKVDIDDGASVCMPTFLPPDLQEKFYHWFCKQQL